jgi:molybdopterin-biosynthesis enzyme MoeA-like protein
MTRLPKGAELVLNKISAAPGFMIGNVIVMAGIPQVMQAMVEYVTPQLKTGTAMLSQTVRGDCREGDIGTELGAIAKAHNGVVIGSYPFMEEGRPNTHIVLRSRDPQKLAAAKSDVEAMLQRLHAAAG